MHKRTAHQTSFTIAVEEEARQTDHQHAKNENEEVKQQEVLPHAPQAVCKVQVRSLQPCEPILETRSNGRPRRLRGVESGLGSGLESGWIRKDGLPTSLPYLRLPKLRTYGVPPMLAMFCGASSSHSSNPLAVRSTESNVVFETSA